MEHIITAKELNAEFEAILNSVYGPVLVDKLLYFWWDTCRMTLDEGWEDEEN